MVYLQFARAVWRVTWYKLSGTPSAEVVPDPVRHRPRVNVCHERSRGVQCSCRARTPEKKGTEEMGEGGSNYRLDWVRVPGRGRGGGKYPNSSNWVQ